MPRQSPEPVGGPTSERRPEERSTWARWVTPRGPGAFLVGVGFAVALGAYLTFAGDLKTQNSDGADAPFFLPVAVTGVALTTWCAGWRAALLIPATTVLFASVWQGLFWELPERFEQTSGMDAIGARPMDVVLVLPFAIALAVLIATFRAIVHRLLRRRQTAQA